LETPNKKTHGKAIINGLNERERERERERHIATKKTEGSMLLQPQANDDFPHGNKEVAQCFDVSNVC
jgi:hypothetical protein